MTAEDASPSELVLAGYRPLSRSGFALPCYVRGARANAWYAAVCSVEGDHAAKVAGFVLYDDDEVAALPEDLHRRVRMGDPWVDVFLWNGPRVGTPGALLDGLRGALEEVAAAVPISLLDLMLSAGDDDLTDLVTDARRHIESTHGVEVADEWCLDLFTGQAQLELRRLLASSPGTASPSEYLRGVRVNSTDGGPVASLPAAVAAALPPDGLERLRETLRRLGERLGTPIELEVNDVPQQPSDMPDPRTAENSVKQDCVAGAEARILVVSSGPRARAIARHVSKPDWSLLDTGGRAAATWVVRTGREVGRETGEGVSVIDVMDGDRLPTSSAPYDAVVWLLDDEVALGGDLDAFVQEVAGRKGRHSAAHLLALALPTYEPSRVLTMLAERQGLSFPCDAVIDTALARSPFWTGNPWRAVDRRVADTVVGSALVAAMDWGVRDALLRGAGRSAPPLFSHALGHGGPDGADPKLGLLSESSTFGLEPAGRSDQTFGFDLVPLDRSMQHINRGYAAIREPEFRFQRFAGAVVASVADFGPAAAAGRRGPVRRSQAEEPRFYLPRGMEREDAAAGLRMPNLAAGIDLQDRGRLMVTAEAPTPKAVRRALEAGWATARYTDRETISEVLAGDRDRSEPPLPRELRLPQLQRAPSNRGLAVRGIDPRDVLRLPAADAFEWRDARQYSHLAELGREYRERVDQPEVRWVVFPRAAVEAALNDGDPAAESLIRLAKKAERPSIGGALKRPADLRVAWAHPPPRLRRFVLEDGRLPVRMAELPRHAVPAQRMFVIDGDVSVPMLFASRVFAIWAHATTSRSTSWSPRFSVSRTFETMPVPGLFRPMDDVDGWVWLRLDSEDSALIGLSAVFEDAMRGGDHQFASLLGSGRRGPLADLDKVVLHAIGLGPGAPDVEVLERLLQMNSDHVDRLDSGQFAKASVYVGSRLDVQNEPG